MSQPVFVVGKPRSGTTFMWSYLVGFQEYVEPFVRSDFTRKGRRFLPDGKWATSESGCFTKNFDHGVASLKRALASSRKAILVEKSPSHTKLVDRISISFPNSKFIYMTRPIDERYDSFTRHWPTPKEQFYASDKGWEPPTGTIEQLSGEGRLLLVSFSKMKEETTLRLVGDFIFQPTKSDFANAASYAESRPVGLPWAQ